MFAKRFEQEAALRFFFFFFFDSIDVIRAHTRGIYCVLICVQQLLNHRRCPRRFALFHEKHRHVCISERILRNNNKPDNLSFCVAVYFICAKLEIFTQKIINNNNNKIVPTIITSYILSHRSWSMYRCAIQNRYTLIYCHAKRYFKSQF